MISAKFVPLKYYTLSSQLRRLTSFSVGLFGSGNSVTRSYPVMRKSCISLPNKQSGKYNEMDPILIGTAVSGYVIREMIKTAVPLVKEL